MTKSGIENHYVNKINQYYCKIVNIKDRSFVGFLKFVILYLFCSLLNLFQKVFRFEGIKNFVLFLFSSRGEISDKDIIKNKDSSH